jgi:cGMP-dependent protein kinase
MAKSPLDMTKPVDLQIITQSAVIYSNISNSALPASPNVRILSKHSKFSGLQIFSRSSETEKTSEIQKMKNLKDIQEISKCLSKHFLFNSLLTSEIPGIIQEFKLVELKSGLTLFEQNSPGLYFYLINSGKVQVSVNGSEKKTLKKGESFGELALLHESQRTATVKALEDSTFWRLGRDVFRKAVESISKAKIMENKLFVESVPLFQVLTQDQKNALLDVLVLQEFQDGERIVHEGDPGGMMFIVKNGAVSCFCKSKEVRKLLPGDYFGEQALLYNTNRTATVVAVGKTSVLSIGREDLVTSFGAQLQFVIYKNTQRISLESDQILQRLTPSQIESIIEKQQIKHYNQDELVIPKNQPTSYGLYSVLKGCLSSDSLFSLYSVLGSDSIFNNSIQPWPKDILAFENTHIGFISKEDLESVLGGSLKSTIEKNEILTVLKRVQILRTLPSTKLEKLASCLQIIIFQDEDIIFTQGSPGDSFFIVKEGQVEVLKDGVSIRTVTRHDYFGERSIIQSETRTASVISNGKSECWVLSRKDFLSIIDENLSNSLKTRIHLQQDDLKIEDLTGVKIIGSGMFGKVFLVTPKNQDFFYALKTVSKLKVKKFQISDNLILERKILLQVDHPFIVKLVKTFKDKERVYFLLEHVNGIDLFDALRLMNILNNESAKFYTGCLLLTLEHLNERSIIYRDLKPENVMIDSEGYPKLIDFGTSKFLKARTYTIIGTPHYMAPEVIKGLGYSFSADVWSLGVILFEFVCGTVPFGEDLVDPLKIYQVVIERQLKFPAFFGSHRAKAVIEKLLDLNPARRGSAKDLKANNWFAGLDWDFLISRQVKAPFLPRVEDLEKMKKNIEGKSLVEMVVQSEENENNGLWTEFEEKVLKPEPFQWDDEF